MSLPVGLVTWQLILYGILIYLSTQFHHANISLGKVDPLLRWLFVTPDMHKIHHSRLPRELNSNDSTVFSCWDRLAGTFRTRPHLETIDFGLSEYDDPDWQTLPGMRKTPFSPPPSQPAPPHLKSPPD